MALHSRHIIHIQFYAATVGHIYGTICEANKSAIDITEYLDGIERSRAVRLAGQYVVVPGDIRTSEAATNAIVPVVVC